MNLPHIASKIFDTPLAIEPGKMHMILQVLSDKFCIHSIEGLEHSDFEPTEGEHPDDAPGNIALIPVPGVLVHRAVALDPPSMLTSYGEIAAQLSQAVEDESITAIVLDIDSPGGEVNGLFELVQDISAATKEKPVFALVDELATSAAFAIASAATRIIAPQTAVVGSIDVIATHVDQSKRDEAEGINVTFVTSGDRKAEGNPHEPLSNEARAHIQAQVNRIDNIMTDMIAANRSVSAEAIHALEGRTLNPVEALEMGLIDEIAPVRQALANIAERHRRDTMQTFFGAITWAEAMQDEDNLIKNCLDSQRGSLLYNQNQLDTDDQKEGGNMGKLATILSNALAAKAEEETARNELIGQLADAAGVTTFTMNNVLEGQIQGPPMKALNAWAEILGLETDELVKANKEDGFETEPEEAEETESETPAAKGNVIPFSHAQARDEGITYAAEVRGWCEFAGCPERAEEFIKQGMSLPDIRRSLMKATSNETPGEEISGQHADGGGEDTMKLWEKVLQKNGMLAQEPVQRQ